MPEAKGAPRAAAEFKEIAQSEIHLGQGTIRYRELGSGRPIVLVHGLLVNSLLWADVAQALAEDYRVLAPDWPLGSHTLPLESSAEITPPALAGLIAEFLEALNLEDVTLVGNDTGGALCQLVATHHPERIGRLVLTPCDAYENFLPPMFRPLQLAARIPGSVWLLANALRPRFAQRLPFSFGWLSKRPIDDSVMRAFLDPALHDAAIRREIGTFLRAIDKSYTLEAARRFASFEKPVLIAWAPEDRFFGMHYAERMASAFPNARLERIENSWTFVPIDQPERTAGLIAAFAGDAGPSSGQRHERP